jgi:hypothetical protein
VLHKGLADSLAQSLHWEPEKAAKVMLEKGPFSHVSLPSQQYQNIWD